MLVSVVLEIRRWTCLKLVSVTRQQKSSSSPFLTDVQEEKELPHAVRLPPLTSQTRHWLTPTPPPPAPLISTLNSATLCFTQPHLLTKIPLSPPLCHSAAISAAQINHVSKRKVHINMRGHSISASECQGDRGYPGRRDGEVTAVRCRAAAPGVDGVLTQDATMAIKMQMGGQKRPWPGCGLHEAAQYSGCTCREAQFSASPEQQGEGGSREPNLSSWLLYPTQFTVPR